MAALTTCSICRTAWCLRCRRPGRRPEQAPRSRVRRPARPRRLRALLRSRGPHRRAAPARPGGHDWLRSGRRPRAVPARRRPPPGRRHSRGRRPRRPPDRHAVRRVPVEPGGHAGELRVQPADVLQRPAAVQLGRQLVQQQPAPALEYSPGSELFVVYTDDRDVTNGFRPDRGLDLRNRGFVVKFNRPFRF